MSTDRMAEITVHQNTVNQAELTGNVEEFGADVARESAAQAKASAAEALEYRNLSEAWAESSEPPAAAGSRSSKTWAGMAREWAESEKEPDGTAGSKSAKSWAAASEKHAQDAETARANAENERKLSETARAGAAAARAGAEDARDKTAASEAAAKASETAAKDSETKAAASLAQMKVDLKVKADVGSPELIGEPKAPTPEQASNDNRIATTAFVKTEVANLVNAAPSSLDTLKELSSALGDDPNFATTITNLIGTKLGKNENAVSATKAGQDAKGRVIDTTYATLDDLKSAIAASENTLKADRDSVLTEYLPKSGGELTGDLSMKRFDASGAGTESSYTFLRGRAKNNTGGGLSLALGSNGPLQIGSGSSSDAFWESSDNGGNNNLYLTSAGSITLKTNVSTWDAGSTFTFGTDGNLTIPGTVTASRVVNAVYNDMAEFFQKGEETEAGDIIALDEGSPTEQYKKATESSRIVVGVHSDEFGQVMGGMEPPEGEDFVTYNLKHFIPVALAGRVHVRVYGKVAAVDFIVPSDMPGVGRSAKEGESTVNAVGRSLVTDTNENVRRIRILVWR